MKLTQPTLSLLLLLTAGLPQLGCASLERDHPADLGLPFEALPSSVGQTSCSVLFTTLGLGGRIDYLRRYFEPHIETDESIAERRVSFLDTLHAQGENLRPREQMIGTIKNYQNNFDSLGEHFERTTSQSFELYASCLTEEGSFACKPVPMEDGLRGSVVCPLLPFPWHEAEPMFEAPEAIEVEYSSIPCTKRHGIHRESCRSGWFIKLHSIRLATE